MSLLRTSLAIVLAAASCLAEPVARRQFLPVRPAGVPLVAVSAEQASFKPYDFGYELGDGLGMLQRRRESADGTGVVRGSYGYQDPLGVRRVVEYVADRDGYRAVVKTNEPGVVGQSPADATFLVEPPPAAAIAQGLIRRPVRVALL